MPDNLQPPAANASDERPHQPGKAEGTKNGLRVSIAVEWLIDTGAEISTITAGTATNFDLTATGGSASATTGGGGILVNSGLQTRFEVLDQKGNTQHVTFQRNVGVKQTNTGSDILGVDQIGAAGAQVEWDPTAKLGRLRIP